MHEELSDAGARTIRTWTVVWFALVAAVGALYPLFAAEGLPGGRDQIALFH